MTRRFLLKQRRIPSGRRADGLRKNRRVAVVGDAVQRFAPIIVSRKSKPPNRRRAVLQLRDFFGERHAADQIVFARRATAATDHARSAASLISGMRVAAAEYASAISDALNETTDSPEAFFTSNVLNFALSLLAENETVSGPLSESSSCSTAPVM